MSGITTHVLDVSIGRPAAGIMVTLERQSNDGEWETIGSSRTDNDGRVRDLVSDGEFIIAGVHRLTFDVGEYFNAKQVVAFYPEVTITFIVKDPSQHYHVPLLLNPFGYSTYRGS